MTTYQVLITLGSNYQAITEVLVSKSEAESILLETHPALKPIIKEEAVMDLQMKIAGDDFETVQIRFV